MKNLTKKDKALIKEAEYAFEWQDVAKLEEKTKSDEVKRILKYRRISLFHKEEAFADNL